MVRIIGVPGLNAVGRTGGCRNAARDILSGLDNILSNEKGNIVDMRILDISELGLNNNNLDEQEKGIFERAKQTFLSRDRVIFLGGDHSISFPLGKAFLESCKTERKEECLIVFDAHPDCKKAGKNPANKEWLSALINSGFNSKNILLVGARNCEREEVIYLSEKKIRQISINELNNNLEEVCDLIMEFASGKELYVSFDIDVIDPVFAPGTGEMVPGGLTSRQAIYILSRISLMKNLRALDIVELDSEDDKKRDKLTIKLCSKLLAEFL